MKKEGLFTIAALAVPLLGGLVYIGYQKQRQRRQELEIVQSGNMGRKSIPVVRAWGKNSSIITRMTQLTDRGTGIQDFFVKYGYNNIAIYGTRELGEELYHQLKGTEVSIKYVVDRHENGGLNSVTQLKPSDKWEKVDAFVVTTMLKFDELENEITERLGCPVVSIEEILLDLE
mgnify:CR=1 FL=1